MVLARKTHIGGIGLGQHDKVMSDDIPAVPYAFKEGDATLVQLEDSTIDAAQNSNNVTTMTFYQMMRKIESKGL
eukprot:7706864-Alexandrium_andersonii.AAC.1